MTTILAAAVVAFAVWRLGDLIARHQHEAAVRQLLQTFAPAAAAVQDNPKQLLVWQPLAQAGRKLFPQAFADLDRASVGTFPFTKEQLQAAHARCSSDWLAWERAHDTEFAVKAAEIQDQIDRAGSASPLLRSRLAALEQQKLERYQQRYEEYVRTSKALAAFTE